jgi:ubiquinone/menaquinone biosynthesis C-methylase UbiE
MSRIDEYSAQYQWRDWQTLYAYLPELNGKSVLDLGCGIGDQSHDFSDLGAYVTGVDQDIEFIRKAQSRHIPAASFWQEDISQLTSFQYEVFDMIWASFVLAYFPDQTEILRYWCKFLSDNGIIVLVEMDDLLNHQPVAEKYKKQLQAFYQKALAEGKYDFHSGTKIHQTLENAGFRVLNHITLHDAELSFNGPASSAIYKAWQKRLSLMSALRQEIGDHFVDDFLNCIQSNHHKSLCSVHAIIARKSAD